MVDKVGGVEFDVTIDSTGAVAAGSKIIQNNEKIEDSFQDIDLAAKGSSKTLVKGSKDASKALGGMGRKAGMAGVQVQQLVGQIQGGQNVFGALSAQAADLGIVLGAPLIGSIAGLSAAFAGVLLPSLFDTEEKTDDLIEKLKQLAETQILSKEQAALLAQEERRLIKEKENTIKATKESIKANNDENKAMANTIARGQIGQETYNRLQKLIKENTEENVKHAASIRTIGDENKNSTVLLSYYESAMNGAVKQTKEQQAAVAGLVSSIESQASSIGKTSRELAVQEATQRGATDSQIEAINTAFDVIEAEEKRKAAFVESQREMIKAEREAQKERARIAQERSAMEAESDQRVANVERIKASMATEAELRDQKFASDIEALRAALANEELTKAEYDALELARAQSHAAALIAIEQNTANQRAAIEEKHNNVVSSFRNAALKNAANLLDIFAGESRIAAIASIAINKGLALAQNTQNTLVAQTRALSDLGPIAGPPMAAKIGTYGAINAGLIAATGLAQAASLGGGGGSFSGGLPATNVATGASAQGGIQQNNQDISISVTGGDDAGRSILNLVNMTIANGGKIGGG